MYNSEQTPSTYSPKVVKVNTVLETPQLCTKSNRSRDYIMRSPIGHIYTNACTEGLHCVRLYGGVDNIELDTKVELIPACNHLPTNDHVNKLMEWVRQYISQPLEGEKLELSLCKGEDSEQVKYIIWKTIRDKCAVGKLLSENELAQEVGLSVEYSKEISDAIDKNPYKLVIGDHRIVKASGEIWGKNDSHHYKLRRLLVNHEVNFIGETLEEAQLKVKNRCKVCHPEEPPMFSNFVHWRRQD